VERTFAFFFGQNWTSDPYFKFMKLNEFLFSSVIAKIVSSLKMNRGAFILFEGIDRCGKTTQSTLLTNFLNQKRKTELIRFPNRNSTIGQLINSYLTTTTTTTINDQTIHLLFSANRWECSTDIINKLNDGVTLVKFTYLHTLEK
jgi:dTMP kinase